MHANLHRHHGMGVCGKHGSLLLLISVPSRMARAAGDEHDGNNACYYQIAAPGRHLAMANLGFVCRGNGRQGNIAHGDGLVHGWCGTQARKLASQRILGRQAVEQDGFLTRVGFGLVAGLAFGVFVICLIFGRLNVVCILIIGLRLGFRLILHINARIVKRNLVK